MNITNILFKKLLFFFLIIPLSGCPGNTYLQWWDEEMFLYRPSVIEAAALRTATQKKFIQVGMGKILEISFGLTLRNVETSNPNIVLVSIDEQYYPHEQNKTIVFKGINKGIASVYAYLIDGRKMEIVVNVN